MGKEPLLVEVEAEVDLEGEKANKAPNFALIVVSITIQMRSVTFKIGFPPRYRSKNSKE